MLANAHLDSHLEVRFPAIFCLWVWGRPRRFASLMELRVWGRLSPGLKIEKQKRGSSGRCKAWPRPAGQRLGDARRCSAMLGEARRSKGMARGRGYGGPGRENVNVGKL